MGDEVLTDRALGRATLARQFLLERTDRSVVDVVSHLVGMQSQVPMDPYVALWSRLTGFEPGHLVAPFVGRELVRIVLLRGTLHLVTADDALALRPLAQPILDLEMRNHGIHKAALATTDAQPVVAALREVLAARPLNGNGLRAAIAERFPDVDAAAMAFACRNHLALVQVPPRGVWGKSLGVTVTTLESWVGREQVAATIDDVLLRYLDAFGPATAADATTWSRLTGVREVLDRLRPQLRTFRNERGQELFDRPDAPRPGPDVEAPARFLPTYDNIVLGDPPRFVDDGLRRALWHATGAVHGTAWFDGRVVSSWHLDRPTKPATGQQAVLVVHHLGPLPKPVRAALTAEGAGLLALHDLGRATTDLRFDRIDP